MLSVGMNGPVREPSLRGLLRGARSAPIALSRRSSATFSRFWIGVWSRSFEASVVLRNDGSDPRGWREDCHGLAWCA